MSSLLPDVRGLPRAFWILCLGTLVNRVGGFVSPFLSIYLTTQRGLPVEQAGGIVSLIGLGSIGSGPVGGFLADRLGRRPALAIATLLGGSAMLAMGWARDPVVIAPLAFVLGFCGEMYRPIVSATVADLVPPEDRPRAYGFLYWVVNLGFSFALPLAGFVASRSYAALFIGDAVTTFLFGALAWASIPETHPERHRVSGFQWSAVLAPYRDPAFRAFLGVSLLLGIVFLQLNMTVPLEMNAHGISNATYGLILSLNGLMIVFVQPFVAPLVHRQRRGSALALSAVLTGVGFGLTGAANGVIPIYVFSVVVWTLGEIVMSPVTPTVIADLAPPSLRGTYQGAHLVTWGAASFLAPRVGSSVMGTWGSSVLWSGCALVGLVSAIGFLNLTLLQRAPAPQTALRE